MSDPSTIGDFVGRSVELASFERAVAAARRGDPHILLIGGDAGIGKSTFVTEGARRAAAALLVGRCIPMGGELMPLAPLADVLRSVRRTSPTALSDPAVAPLVDWVAPGHAAEQSTGAAVFAPLLELIAGLGCGDVVVVAFEDLHWADSLTWDLFDFLGRNLVDEHVVLVGTYRANEVALSPQQRRRLAELMRLPAVERMHLGGLARDELAAKMQRVIGDIPTADLVDEILRRSEGNPFFAAELVAAHLSGQTIPAGLADLIAIELEGLDAVTRAAVEVIAVAGHGSGHDLLLRALDVEADRLEGALHAAIDAKLIVVDRDADGYRLRHALIGEVVYADLLPPERKRLHRRIADVLADQPANILARADRAGELAFHLDRGGDLPAAFTALLRAADAAETVAPAAALRHLERALELWDSADGPARAESRVGRLWQAAELASGAVGNERAATLAREAFRHGEPPRGVAWGHERLGRYLWAAGHIEESATEFALAASLLPADARGAAAVLAGLGQSELMLAKYAAAESGAQRVFALLGSAEADPAAWVTACRVLGIVVDHAGEPDRGVELCRQAVATAPNALTRMLALLYLGVALLDAGEYEEAATGMLDAATEARLTGLDRSFGGYLDALAAEALVRRGRWSEAESVLRNARGTEAFPLGELRLALSGAAVAARHGDRARTHAMLGEAEARPVDPLHRWFLDRTAAEAWLALGQWAAAANVAERALARGAAALWGARFVMYGAVAEVELALDAIARREPCDTEAVRVRLRARLDAARAAARANPSGMVAHDSAAHLAHAAAVVTRLHDPDPEAWAEAARSWGRLGDVFWVATARLHEAEAAITLGDAARAAEVLREAHQLAVGIGSEPLTTHAAAVAKRTRLSLEPPVAAVLDDGAIDQLGLTPREAEVLSLVSAGHTNRRIGETLFVSEKTVSVHVSNILRKLGVSSRVDAAAVAQRVGIT